MRNATVCHFDAGRLIGETLRFSVEISFDLAIGRDRF